MNDTLEKLLAELYETREERDELKELVAKNVALEASCVALEASCRKMVLDMMQAMHWRITGGSGDNYREKLQEQRKEGILWMSMIEIPEEPK